MKEKQFNEPEESEKENDDYQYTGELWNADPNCHHHIIYPPGGGVACSKCPGWFCY